MFKQLQFQNFKSWQDTGEIKLAPITGFFGTNSSGKSAILQFLLMLKQTMESSDRQRVLHTGDDKTYVNLGTIYDISYNHEIPCAISFNLGWDFADILTIPNPELPNDKIFSLNYLVFASKIQLEKKQTFVDYFHYEFQSNYKKYRFKLRLNPHELGSLQRGKDQTYILRDKRKVQSHIEYELKSFGYELKRSQKKAMLVHHPWPLSVPIKNYGFPDEISSYFQNAGFLSDFVLAYEKAFQNIYYLGPLREYPKRVYSWAGENPQDVGHRGELAISALLASQQNIEEKVAYWLKELGLIDSFRVTAIAENRQYYEVRVKRTPNASEVLITDVGFGVSQILPVLVLCYYAPEGSTLILEQPEIHLHPSVQSGLADVFIDVIKTRKLQIILESHSEHLLRRLQRRIAEEKGGLTNEDMSLYFCNLNSDGSSKLTSLELDQFGNIANWPENFFGDEMGDLFAMTEAAMERQMREG